jgi:ubiquitin-protein ligase
MNIRSRISKEYKEVCKIPKDHGIGAKLVNGDLNHWTGMIAGPDNTPYAGGLFVS